MIRLIFTMTFSVLVLTLYGQCSYTTSATGDYFTPSNWANGIQPPNPIPNGVTVTLSHAMTIGTGSKLENNGTLTGGSTLTILSGGGYGGNGTFNGNIINNGTVSPGLYAPGTIAQTAAVVAATTAVTGITATGATTGGEICHDGGATITARGVCYGQNSNPDINGLKTTDGTGTGTFVSTLSGLTASTTYYVRAYATNSINTSYGPEISFMTSVASGATFTNPTNNTFVFSVNDLAIPLNVQGTLAINTTVNVPYTAGVGTYIAYTSPDVAIAAAFCEDGASDWTLGYSYSAGTFSASGNIVVTLITKKAGVVTAWPAKRVVLITTINFNCVAVPWIVNGNSYSNTVGVDEGGDAIRGSLSTSGAAYDGALVDEAIVITAAEYNNLMNVVPGATRYGATTALMNTVPNSGTHFVFNTTISANGLGGFPIGSYVCGVWTKSGTVELAGDYWYFSNGSTNTCSNIRWKAGHLGSPSANTNNYWAVKRPTTNSILSNSAILIGNGGYGANIYQSISAGGYFNNAPNTCTTNIASGDWSGLQVITSTQKSW